jgi:hypothetical protein
MRSSPEQRPRHPRGAVQRPDPPGPQPGHLPARPKLGVPVTDITKMTIWGNHSATQYPDLFQRRGQREERRRGRQRRGLDRDTSSRPSPSVAPPSSRPAACRRPPRPPTRPSTTCATGCSAPRG